MTATIIPNPVAIIAFFVPLHLPITTHGQSAGVGAVIEIVLVAIIAFFKAHAHLTITAASGQATA